MTVGTAPRGSFISSVGKRRTQLYPNRGDVKESGKREAPGHQGREGKSAKVVPMPLGTVVLEKKWETEARWDEGPRFSPGFWCQWYHEEYSNDCRSQLGCKCPCTSRASLQMLGNPFMSRAEHLDEQGRQDQGRQDQGRQLWPKLARRHLLAKGVAKPLAH